MLLCGLAAALAGQDLQQVGHAKPMQLNGGLSVQGGPYFHMGDGIPRNQPYWWAANGNLNLSLYGWQVPFSFNLGPQARSFSQPFNRYGMSPYYKWVRLHLGYRSMRFNPYTLSGLQFFGAGVELEPKGFRFAAFYGRFNKPVAQDTLAAITPIPTYRRIGYGVKIGVGSPRTYVDLMLFRAADDTASIGVGQQDPRFAPKENLALGLSGRIMLSKRVSGLFDVGASVLNPDLRYPELRDQDASVNIPNVFTTRLGARALFAGNASLNYTDRILVLRLLVRHIDPDYHSLGTFYQQTDLRAITVEPSVRLWKNKVRVGGSFGKQHDNLYGRKLATSVRNIGSINLSLTPNRVYGIDLRFTNYGIAQEAGLQALSDTFRVAQVNRNMTVSQRYTRTNAVRTVAMNLTAGMQDLVDLNPYGTYSSSENNVLYGNFFISRIRTRDNLALNGGLNYSRNNTLMGTYELMGPTLGFTLALAGSKLSTSLNGTWNQALQEGADAGSMINLNTLLQYVYSPSHRFQLSAFVLRNNTTVLVAQRFTELRFMAGYVFVFRPKH